MRAAHSSSVYPREGAQHLIELERREARQLFNSLDPAPFLERDIDHAAEQYLVDAVRELGLRRKSKRVIHVPSSGPAGEDAGPVLRTHCFPELTRAGARSRDRVCLRR
jgi:hypothetical protein